MIAAPFAAGGLLDPADELHAVGAVDAVADGTLRERDDDEPRRRPEEEGVMVGLRRRPALAERGVREPRRVAEVGDVEERELRAGRLVVRADVLADPEQQVAADRVQVRRVAGQLDLARARRGRAGSLTSTV